VPPRPIVAILEADPELGESLTAADFAAASTALVARCLTVAAGPWDPAALYGADPPAVGLLVLEGLLTREVVVAGRPSTELLGPTDLLRPWDQDGNLGLVPMDVGWQALQPARIAVLDGRFLHAVLRHPPVIEALLGRTLRRARWLAFLLSMKQITRIEGRVLLLLWALAERWGRVTPRGVHVRLRLTHEQIGRLVGARRPSVTTALGALATAGMVERDDHGWLLFGDVQDATRHAAGELHEAGSAR
jgi:CRP/FNR family cyclic AMP-dependent transcriptional regulator